MKNVILCAGLVVASLHAFAQGTAFTYQGRLQNGSNPADGSYDLRFSLFDAASDGLQRGGNLTNSATAISNGLFTATVDFGNQYSSGEARWLEVAVRTNGGGAFTILTPRQPLTATPYALYAGAASLAGDYGNAVNFNNAANQFSGNGSNLTALNASQLTSGTIPEARLSANVALRAGGNAFSGNQIVTGGKLGIGTATPSNLLDVAAGGIIGNSTVLGANQHDILNRGTKVSFGYNISSTEFLGMSAVVNPGTARCGNSGDLLFYAWECNTAVSREVMRINGSGNVGIGTTTNPVTTLDVRSFNPAITVGTTFDTGGALYFGNSAYGVKRGYLSLNDVGLYTTAGNVHLSADGPFKSQFVLETNGNVGIGTSSPGTKLTVVESTYGIEHTDGTRRLATYLDASGCFLGTRSADPLLFYVNDGAADMMIATNGTVGIGTMSPGTKLTVAETGYGIEHTDGTRRLATYLDARGCYVGTRSVDPLLFYVNDGESSMMIDTNGNVGIGLAPTTRLDVGGTVKALNFIGDASGLTGLDANGMGSGTLPNERLSTDVARRTGGNLFFGQQNISGNQSVDGTVTANSFIGDGSGLSGVALRIGGNAFTGNQTFTGGSVGIGASSPLNMGGASYPGSWDGLHTRSLAGDGLNIIQGAKSARLHLRADNNLADGSQDFIINNSANRIDFSWLTPGLANRLSAMTIATNGNVGIGINNPTAKLLVNGETQVNGRLTVNGAASDFGKVALIVKQLPGTVAVGSFVDSSNRELVTVLDPVASGSFTFYVNTGDAAKPGGGAWAALSDARVKKNIRDLSGALPRLLALHSVSFEYKDPKAPGARAGTQIGFVAQEVEPIFPDWVTTDAKGMKMVSIHGFESLTVAALRELQAEKDAQVKKLEAQNAELKHKTIELETRLAALEKLMTRVAVAKAGE